MRPRIVTQYQDWKRKRGIKPDLLPLSPKEKNMYTEMFSSFKTYLNDLADDPTQVFSYQIDPLFDVASFFKFYRDNEDVFAEVYDIGDFVLDPKRNSLMFVPYSNTDVWQIFLNMYSQHQSGGSKRKKRTLKKRTRTKRKSSKKTKSKRK